MRTDGLMFGFPETVNLGNAHTCCLKKAKVRVEKEKVNPS
jgi:hypothetical protein